MEKESFGVWFSKQLEKNRYSRLEFSKKIKVSHSSVDFWANDQVLPRPGSCKKIADALGVPYQEVMRLAGHLPVQPEDDVEIKEVVEMMRQLSPDERRGVLEYVRWRYRQQQEK